QAALTSGQVRRAELFLQSKFTFRDGQDHRLPYDPNAAVAKQVAQSFASSCEHLGVEYLDSLVLHGPSQSGTLGAADHEAWRAMEQLVLAGSVGVIGISNVAATQLRELLQFARVAPTFVQNRCYASRGWDAAIRAICVDAGVIYQGFSLLTANRTVLAAPAVLACAQKHGRSPEQIVFRFALQAGMLPLTGSSDMSHLHADLACFDFELSTAETEVVAAAAIAPVA
ncbi:MAG TPA: aldo/keto reductase, partial [Kofleriaceae bacterium]|nr:aldo/keto reductase [Kofleriaceae bacterium]